MIKDFITIGIDPGLDGAWAVLNADGSVHHVDDMPTYDGSDGKRHIHAIALYSVVRLAVEGSVGWEKLKDGWWNGPVIGVVENVGARPNQGSVSGFRFGVTKGIAIGVLAPLVNEIVEPYPQAWKRAMGVTSSKQSSLDKATEIWGEDDRWSLKKHADRAEAMLMAEHIRRTHVFKVN